MCIRDSCYEVSNSIHYRVCSNSNLPPIAVNDIFNTVQDKPVSGSVLTNDRDPEGGPLTVTTTPVTPPTKGTVVMNANGTFTYTPNPGATGQDVFCYEISDNAGLKSTACVTINILPAPTVENNKPIAADDATETYLNTAVVIKVKANDVDPCLLYTSIRLLVKRYTVPIFITELLIPYLLRMSCFWIVTPAQARAAPWVNPYQRQGWV